jgi:ABC-2 type transport system ATP-binding protein
MSFPPTLRVREVLEFGAAHFQAHPPVGELLRRFGLAEVAGRQTGGLSGGQRRRLAVALSFVGEPSLLVLDEPTAGLSPQLAHELLHDHVGRLASTGVAILLVEQHAREALAISDWAYVLASGQVALADSASALLERPDIHEIFLGRTAAAVE